MSELDSSTSPIDGMLRRNALTLAQEFVGVYAAETVEHCLRDSFERLAATATVTTYLPLLAERFARERLRATGQDRSTAQARSVLFVCTHNAGRSQIAAAWLHELAPHIDVWSAGTAPIGEISRAVVDAMAEVGIDLSGSYPKPLTDEIVGAADVVVTMGCGEACPVVAGRRYEDWVLAHALGDSVVDVRGARDELRDRVVDLLAVLDEDVTA